MTTFTMQDLNTRNINDLPTTQEEDEAMDALARLGAGVGLKDIGVNAFETPVFSIVPPHAPEPQPTLCESTQTLEQILKTIGEQFTLLSTVINQTKAQPDTTPPEGNQSLQETIELVLKQSDWFATMVEEQVNDLDLSDQIETHVQRYCENYFSYNFDAREHFDFDEAVSNAVEDKLEEVVSEKLSEANISISF